MKSKLVNMRARVLRPVIVSNEEIQVKLNELSTLLHEQASAIQVLEKRLVNSGTMQLPSGEIMTKIFSGAKMYLDPHDVALVPHLVLDGDWERNITRAWLKVVRAGDVVVDIGANFGYFGILAAQQTNRQCKVISFEANTNLIPYLKKTFNVNGFDALSSIENLAVSNEPGNVTLNVLENYIGSSSLHSLDIIKAYSHSNPDVKVASKVSVKATTLDKYCQEKGIKELHLIKMDIEGFEAKAYEGMRGIVRNSPALTLFVEFTKEAYENPKEFYEQMLADFGNVYLITDEGELYKPKSRDYQYVIEESQSDWVMPVFSKKADLIKK